MRSIWFLGLSPRVCQSRPQFPLKQPNLEILLISNGTLISSEVGPQRRIFYPHQIQPEKGGSDV